jgi:hypothetical protein
VAIQRCDKGHFYDDVKYGSCPHCSELEPESGEDSRTVSLGVSSGQGPSPASRELQALVRDERTVSLGGGGVAGPDPVVGWLVCVEGPEKGRDYRMHSGRNFVGRSLRMDVSIADDSAITRENHCSVVYDPKDGLFFVVPGEGTNTYFNGTRLVGPAAIDDGDMVRIGDSAFCFVAYCKGERRWL